MLNKDKDALTLTGRKQELVDDKTMLFDELINFALLLRV
jgi:hypothetical protein